MERLRRVAMGYRKQRRGGDVRAACTIDLRAKMTQYRAWFHERRRPRARCVRSSATPGGRLFPVARVVEIRAVANYLLYAAWPASAEHGLSAE
jgi:hypothetical protein